MSLRADRKRFRFPPTESRPSLTWYWNDALEAERLVAQLDSIADQGFGGVVIQAAEGLDKNDHLSDAWFDAVTAVARRARKRSVTISLGDGFGMEDLCRRHALARSLGIDGAAEGESLFSTRLVIQDFRVDASALPEATLLGPCADVVASFVVVDESSGKRHELHADSGVTLYPDPLMTRPVLFDVPLAALDGRRVLTFRSTPVEGRFNYLDARAARRFLDDALDGYLRHHRRYFGAVITHVTIRDAGLSPEPAQLPWDPELETLFRETRGYSLAPHLPALFFDTPDCESVRFDYWTLITEMFREGFAEPVHQWCTEHKLTLSCHLAGQGSLKEVTRRLGSTMPIYGFQDLPAITLSQHDAQWLNNPNEDYLKNIVAIKQATSVRNQLDKPGVISEWYAGGANPLSEARASALLQLTLGVTDVRLNASYYSTRGERADEALASLGTQQPFWPSTKRLNDTVARGSSLLKIGRHVCNVLLLHPAASMQCTYRQELRDIERKDDGRVLDAHMVYESIEKHFTLISSALLDAQIDFDYGNEELLAAHGRCRQLELLVGEQSYSIVVLPPIINLRSSTLTLLNDFASGGGHVVVIGTAPRLLDGLPSYELSAFLDEYVTRVYEGVEFFDYCAVIRILTKLGGRLVDARSEDGGEMPALKVHRRKGDNLEIIWLANMRDEPIKGNVSFDVEIDGQLEEWILDTGEMFWAGRSKPSKSLHLSLKWEANQVRVFAAVRGRRAKRPSSPSGEVEGFMTPEWHARRLNANQLALTSFYMTIGEDEYGPLTIKEGRKILADYITTRRSAVTATTACSFDCSPILPVTGACTLRTQLGKNATLQMNDATLEIPEDADESEPWLYEIPIPQPNSGENSIKITAQYADASELCIPEIRGDFLLASRGGILTLEHDPGINLPGTWDEQGLLHYVGRVRYTATVEAAELADGARVALRLPGLRGAAEIRVNEATVDHVLWPPFTCDLTAHWKKGAITLEIDVANALPTEHDAPFAAGLLTHPELIFSTCVTEVSAEEPEPEESAEEDSG